MKSAYHGNRKQLAVACLAALCLTQFSGAAFAGKDKIKIGVLSDQSGPYQDLNGKGSVMAARMAIEEMGGKVLGKPVELIDADPQNKNDVGVAIAKAWIDRDNVDVIADTPTSSMALAISEIVKGSKNALMLLPGPSASPITGASCSPYHFAWSIDNYAIANLVAKAMLSQGGNSWYLIVTDQASGEAAASNLKTVLDANGGSIVGSVKFPANTMDYSSYLLQAQASKAKVVALMASGSDLVGLVKQANEYRLTQGGQKIVSALALFGAEVKAMGLQVGQSLVSPNAYEGQEVPAAKAWEEKFRSRFGKMPSAIHIATYSSIRHYLKAVAAAKTDNRDAVAAKMREIPVNDAFVQNGKLRIDGRMVHDLRLLQVKAPAESKNEWDLFKVARTVPAAEAFVPLEKSGCPLVK